MRFGMIALGIFLLLTGLTGLTGLGLAIPVVLTAIVALIASVLILVGK